MRGGEGGLSGQAQPGRGGKLGILHAKQDEGEGVITIDAEASQLDCGGERGERRRRVFSVWKVDVSCGRAAAEAVPPISGRDASRFGGVTGVEDRRRVRPSTAAKLLEGSDVAVVVVRLCGPWAVRASHWLTSCRALLVFGGGSAHCPSSLTGRIESSSGCCPSVGVSLVRLQRKKKGGPGGQISGGPAGGLPQQPPTLTWGPPKLSWSVHWGSTFSSLRSIPAGLCHCCRCGLRAAGHTFDHCVSVVELATPSAEPSQLATTLLSPSPTPKRVTANPWSTSPDVIEETVRIQKRSWCQVMLNGFGPPLLDVRTIHARKPNSRDRHGKEQGKNSSIGHPLALPDGDGRSESQMRDCTFHFFWRSQRRVTDCGR